MNYKHMVVFVAALSVLFFLSGTSDAKKPTSDSTVPAVENSPDVNELEPINTKPASYEVGPNMQFRRPARELRPLPICNNCGSNKPQHRERENLSPNTPVSVSKSK